MKRFAFPSMMACLAILLASSALATIPFTKEATGPAQVTSDNGNSAVQFEYGTTTGNDAELPGTDIVLANLTTASTTAGALDVFTSRPYSIDLNITDEGSTASQLITVTGLLSGTLSADSAIITNVFTAPPTPYFFTLGSQPYVLTAFAYVAPEKPGSPNKGAIGAHIQAGAIPEPGSMALIFVGLLPLTTMIRRRR